MEKPPLINSAQAYSTDLLKNQLSPDLVFHDFDHTQSLVDAVNLIGTGEKLNDEELEIALVAMWFHATGYKDTYDGYEEKSKEIATAFLKKEKVSSEKSAMILDSISSIKSDQAPKNNIEKVLSDSIISVIQEDNFKDRLKSLRKELAAIQQSEQSEIDALQNHLERILQYNFYTDYGKQYLSLAKDKLKSKLEKRINKLQKLVDESLSSDLGVTAAQLKAMKKKLQKAQGRPERGIETMFRLTSKNHLDLSGMADSKANIMISINSIIMSVVLGSLMQKLDSNAHLIYPTIMLLSVNLGSLIFAILSLRPNVSNGLFTREDIENQKTNLLFFGNFHRMKRKDYHWGMNKLMENANFLYSNLIDDIYFLGVVLARKYKLLRISYNIFMYGMVIVVIAYIVSLNFVEEPIKDSIINTLQE